MDLLSGLTLEIALAVAGSAVIAVVVTFLAVYFHPDNVGRRRYGADNWARMKEEELRKWEREEKEEEKRIAEKRRQREEEIRLRAEQDQAPKNCPVCGVLLAKETYNDGYSDVNIDRCPAGHGVWLDHNELEQVAGEEDPLEEYDEWEDDENEEPVHTNPFLP